MKGAHSKNGPGHKEAGPHVYLMEELGDARMRCDQLIRYLNDAATLVEKSSHRDHFFEVAGHLLRGIPEVAFKLQKALNAVALAATRIDYEELKRDLRPEKVKELEQVLQDVRVRQVERRSDPLRRFLSPRQAAEQLRVMARIAHEAGGVMPYSALSDLITALEEGSKVATEVEAADTQLNKLADALEGASAPNPKVLAAMLRRMLGDAHVAERNATEQAVENAMSKAKWKTETAADHGIPANPWKYPPTNGLASGNVEAVDVSKNEWQKALQRDEDLLRKMKSALKTLQGGGKVENLTVEGAKSTIQGLEAAIASKKSMLRKLAFKTPEASEEKETRFEEGKPADPTKNMSPEDKAKWKKQKEKNKDKFKDKEARGPFGELDQVKKMLGSMLKDRRSWDPEDQYLIRKALEHLEGVVGTAGAVADRAYRASGEPPVVAALKEGLAWAGDEKKETRFEEGEPADPTENMSPEDKAKWKKQKEKNKDKFKDKEAWKVEPQAAE